MFRRKNGFSHRAVRYHDLGRGGTVRGERLPSVLIFRRKNIFNLRAA
jgi:hypothetical protein